MAEGLRTQTVGGYTFRGPYNSSGEYDASGTWWEVKMANGAWGVLHHSEWAGSIDEDLMPSSSVMRYALDGFNRFPGDLTQVKPPQLNPSPSAETQAKVQEFKVKTELDRLNKARADWTNYGSAQIGNLSSADNVGLQDTNTSGNTTSTFLDSLTQKYGLLDANVLSGKLDLPEGTKISQADMWKWQSIVAKARKAWQDAYEAKNLYDAYTGTKQQTDFVGNSPYGYSGLSIPTLEPAWNNQNLIQPLPGYGGTPAKEVSPEKITPVEDTTPSITTEAEWTAAHPGETRETWLAANPDKNAWDYAFYINGQEKTGSTMADFQAWVNSVLYPFTLYPGAQDTKTSILSSPNEEITRLRQAASQRQAEIPIASTMVSSRERNIERRNRAAPSSAKRPPVRSPNISYPSITQGR